MSDANEIVARNIYVASKLTLGAMRRKLLKIINLDTSLSHGKLKLIRGRILDWKESTQLCSILSPSASPRGTDHEYPHGKESPIRWNLPPSESNHLDRVSSVMLSMTDA